MAYNPLFEIQDDPGQLTVTRLPKKPLRGKVLIFFFVTILFLTSAGTLLEFHSMHLKDLGNVGRITIATTVFLVIFFYLSFLLGYDAVLTRLQKREVLHCDRTMLTVSTPAGRNSHEERARESYPISEIEEVQFGASGDQVLRSSQAFCLKFNAGGKTVKLLRGLEAPEANTILESLARLGVKVLRDPAMRMLVETVEDHRRSKLRFLWY